MAESARASTPLPQPLPIADADATAFLLRVGRALHRRGLPSHQLEEAMVALCERLGVTANFFATPTALFISFERAARAPDVYLLRVTGASPELGKLSDIDAIGTAVVRGELTPAEGLARIARVEEEPPRYGPALVTAAYALNSGAASVFFGGGFHEVVTSFLIGLVTGLWSFLFGRLGNMRAFEPVAALSASVIACVAAITTGEVSVHVAILAGLIALLPGYTLVVAIAELANGHLASGSSRITAAFIVFLTLGFGVALGTKLTSMLLGDAPAAVVPDALPPWSQAVALGIAASTFAVIFGVKRRDLLMVLVASVLGFSGSRAGSFFLGPELGVFIGALLVGVSANLYARVLDRPAVVPLFPGIMLLVPGSIGFQSLASLMAHDVVSGVQTAFTMVLVAVALVAGLLLANGIAPAKRAL